jgi:signal transduction histidine kinase/ligand-binding sensor domain-containing protein
MPIPHPAPPTVPLHARITPAVLVRCALAWLLCLQLAFAAPEPEDFSFADPYFEAMELVKSPSSVITALTQDAQGWLWIGTGEGLFRYDGYRLRKFVHEDANPASLAGNFVTALWPAPDGRLWVGSQSDGISIFDPHSERFTHLQHDPARPETLAGGRIWALQGDAAGGIWIGCNEGLDYVAPAKAAQPDGTPSDLARLRHFKHQANDPNSLIDNRIRSLLLDRQGTLWIGTVSGLQRYSNPPTAAAAGAPAATASGFVRVASDPANPASLAGQNIQALFQAQDGKLWIGTHKQGAAWLEPSAAASASGAPNQLALHWLHPEPQRPDQLAHGWVDWIIEAFPGEIWLATAGGGITIVSSKDGTVLRQLRHDPAIASSLSHDSVKQILRDHSGMLWIGTWGGGLQRYHPAQRAFHVVRHSPLRQNGLSHPDVRSVLELADGRILVGTGGNGIDIIERKRGRIGGWRPEPGRPGGLPDGYIMSLLEMPDGTLWAGTQQAGVARLAAGRGTGSTTGSSTGSTTGSSTGSSNWQVFGTAHGLPAPLVRRLLLTRDGTLWAATVNGAARWDAETERFVPAQQKDGSGLAVDVLALAEDRQGRLWAASDNGLWLKAAGSAHWQVILHQPDQADSLSGNNIHGLLVDAKDQLWVTSTKGMDRLQGWVGQRAVFEHVGSKVGKPADDVGSDIWQDRQGRIWIGAAEQALDPVALRLSRNGLPDIGASWIGAYNASRDGRLMYGGAQGLSIFDPSQFQPWTFQAPIRVTELKIDGRAVPPGAAASGLRLNPDQRNFSIEFSALDFFKPGEIRYRYRLQGYDRDWISTDWEHRLASYGNLWPGRYILHIQGGNSLDQWNGPELSIPIEVLPAFWQRWWFVLLAVLAALGTIRSLHRHRVARLKAQHHEQAEQLRAMVEQRTAQIVTAHNALAEAHTELSGSHQQLATAHQHLQQTQQQLILQEKMAGLGTLTAGIAHEINNPLNFTHVAAQIQRNELAEFEQYVQSLFDAETDPLVKRGFANHFASLNDTVGIMQEGTERIKAIVQDLRAFTRLDEAEKKTVHLSECLSATVNLVRTSWLEQVEFITEFGDDPPCECWPALLNQVFMNLVLNACQAIAAKQQQHGSSAKGHVWLRLLHHPGSLTVQIEDDGIGMSPDLQKRILEPFFTTREVGSGVGMGLAVSYGIIQKHGGTLEITSTAGQGSCFALHLPLAA